MHGRQHTPRYASRPTTLTMYARAPLGARSPRRARPRARRVGSGLARALLRAVGVMAVLVLLGGGAYALVRSLHQSPEYEVRHVEVEGVSLLTPDEVIKSAGLEEGKPILSYDISKARRDLVSDPMIRDATITRRLPNTIVVRVVERAPLAQLDLNGTRFLVDRAGFLLTQAGAQETLPLIEGVYVKTEEPKSGMQIHDEKLDAGLLVVRLCGESPVLTEIGIRSVNVRNLGNVRLYPKPGPRVADNAVVYLGEGDFGQRLARLTEALEHAPGKRLVQADLSQGRLPPFRFQ